MGYDTFGAKNFDRVQNFIERKIRADGYSTWRRGGTARGGGVTPPVALPAVQGGFTARVLWNVMHQKPSLARCEALLPVLLDAFDFAEINTIDRRAMALAQLGHESVDLLYQKEIWGPTRQQLTYQGRMGNNNPGDGERYQGRDFLQVTGKENYASLSRWAHSVHSGRVTTPTFFVDHPEKLATDEFAFVGFAWYWKVARARLNEAADARNLVWATQMINGGDTGLADRQRRYDEALKFNADLLDPDDDDEEDGVLQTSRSIYRTSNDATMSGSDASRGADACSHMNWVESSANRGEVWALQLVKATANGGVGATKWWEVNAGNQNPGIDPWAGAEGQGRSQLHRRGQPRGIHDRSTRMSNPTTPLSIPVPASSSAEAPPVLPTPPRRARQGLCVLSGLLGLIPILTVFKIITTEQGAAIGSFTQSAIGLAGAFGFAFVAAKTNKQVKNGTSIRPRRPPSCRRT